MRDALSKKIVDIEPSGIRKFFDVVSEIPDAISLGVGEPDFDTPWNVREEGIYALEKGRTFYTSNAGLKELRQEISSYVARKYGCRIMYQSGRRLLWLNLCRISVPPFMALTGRMWFVSWRRLRPGTPQR